MPSSRKSAPKARKSNGNNGFSFSQIISAITSVVRKPLSVLLFVFALTLFVSEQTNAAAPENSIIAQIAARLKTNANLTALGTFIDSNRVATVGFVLHAGAIFAAVPGFAQFIFLIASLLFVYLLPTAGYIEYVLQALFIILFFKLTNSTARIVVVLVAVALWIAGYFLAHLSTTVTVVKQAAAAATATQRTTRTG